MKWDEFEVSAEWLLFLLILTLWICLLISKMLEE
jgi:hypothetical protein